jgi:SAM-dependent methyltransferase
MTTARRPEWWDDVFNRQAFLMLYQSSDLRLAATQVDQIQRLLKLSPPARVLDVCSGYGRHSIELAKRGFTVTGVDISEFQVDEARRLATQAGVAPTFIVGDARDIRVPGPFDAALNMFLSFGYFATDAESQAMLDGIARALRPGGRLLIDFWNREHEIRAFEPMVLDRRDDEILEVEDWTFDHLNGRLTWVNTVIFPDGRRESWTQSIRAFTIVEIKRMLETSGFTLSAVYGGLDGSRYSIDSDAAIFVAERTP